MLRRGPIAIVRFRIRDSLVRAHYVDTCVRSGSFERDSTYLMTVPSSYIVGAHRRLI